jgi:hypothetical protein
MVITVSRTWGSRKVPTGVQRLMTEHAVLGRSCSVSKRQDGAKAAMDCTCLLVTTDKPCSGSSQSARPPASSA